MSTTEPDSQLAAPPAGGDHVDPEEPVPAAPGAVAVNPNNAAQRYILWSNGRIDALGGAPPITSGPAWYDRLDQPVGVAIWITDWTTGQGYVLDVQGGFQPLNGAPAITQVGDPMINANGLPYQSSRWYVDWSWDPAQNGQGYVLDHYGQLYPFGGAPNPPRAGPRWTVPVGRRLKMQWSPSKKALTLDYMGGLHADFEASAPSSGPYWAGQDVARDFDVTDWTDMRGYVLDRYGAVQAFGGAASAELGGPYFPGSDRARTLHVLSASDPLKFWQVHAGGQQYEYVASGPPTVQGGAGQPIGGTDAVTAGAVSTEAAGTESVVVESTSVWMPAPRSFPENGMPAFGRSSVFDEAVPEDLVPSSGRYPSETVRYRSVYLTDMPGGQTEPLTGPVDLMGDDFAGFSVPAEGVIITTEQTWTSRGVGLGRLLHSLALAPGESTRIAMLDFQARTRAANEESISQVEELSTVGGQARSISEITNAVANEQQAGEATAKSVQAAASAYVKGRADWGAGAVEGGATVSASGGIATNVSRSSGTRGLEGKAAQDIIARTDQHATSARSRQSVMVRETSQAEAERVATRVVTNYNHMHPLSLHYYEVVQAYEVATVPVRIERCLFLPMAPVRFTQALLLQYAALLAAAAPTPWAARIAAVDPFAAPAAGPAPPGPSVLPAAGPPPAVGGPGGGSMADRLAAVPSQNAIHSSVTLAKPQNPAVAAPVAIAGSAGGSVLVVEPANGGRIALWDASSQTWSADLPSLSGQPLAQANTAFRKPGYPLALTTTGRLWNLFTNDFVPGVGDLKDISPVGLGMGILEEALFAVGSDGALYQLKVPSGTQTITLERLGTSTWLAVAAADASTVWSLSPDGSCWLWNLTEKSTIEHRPPVPLSTISAARDGTVFGICADAGNAVLYRDTTSGTWYRIPDLRLKEVAAYSATEIFGIDLDGAAAHYTLSPGAASTAPISPQAAASGTTGTGTPVAPAAAPPAAAPLAVAPAAEPQTPDELAAEAARRQALRAADQAAQETEITAIVAHLNENTTYYSPVVWAFADELTLAKNLARYHLPPPEGQPATAGESLAVRLDPQPVAVTGNYLGFRWNFASEADRQAWLQARGMHEGIGPDDPSTARTIGLPTAGVFAEAVLGRANAAEKLDASRFWNWQDSPIPLTAPQIADIQTGKRPVPVDARPATELAPLAAQLGALQALPDPSGVGPVLAAVAASNMFRDQSGLTQATEALTKGIASLTAASTTPSSGSAIPRTTPDGGPRKGPLGDVTDVLTAANGDISKAGALLNTGRDLADRKPPTSPTDGSPTDEDREALHDALAAVEAPQVEDEANFTGTLWDWFQPASDDTED